MHKPVVPQQSENPVPADYVPRLNANLAAVEQRISAACARAGRPRETVTLVAVTKYAHWEWVSALVELGQRNLGENRPQQLVERSRLLSEPVTWHLIGHLQSNKTKSILPVAPWIHSIDSIKLLQQLNRLSGELGRRPNLLLEVNVTGEQSKDGFTLEELRTAWTEVLKCENVDIAGLMTMAPVADDPEQARPAFRSLRQFRDELRDRLAGKFELPHLSMGMTGDFEVAIEEGATLVRIGSALFEGLS